VLLALGMVPVIIARRRHRDGAARPWDLAPLRTRAIVASARHTRPVTDLPVRSPAAARRIGLHQYGPRVGVLVDAFRIELRAKHEDSTIAVAPPRGHKTAAVVIPRVLDAPGAVVTTSTKADVLLATCTRRALVGTLWVFDAEGIARPFAPSWQPLSWDPLEGCRDPDVAIRRAAALVGARPMGGVRNGDFFSSSASGVLRCWLLAAAAGGLPITELNRWLHNLHDTTPAEILDVHLPGWAADLRGLAANPGGEMVGGVLGTLQLVLSPLASPSIAAACTGSGRFRISEFLTSTDTLYLMTEGNADGAGPFVTALVDEIMHQARRASQLREGERLDPPLSMVLDEPANTAAMPHMPTYMSDAGGRGITLTLAPQGWSQMQRRWGTDGAREIWNSATLALVMGGSKETQFLEDISRLAGEYDRDKVSTTRGSGSRSRQHSQQTERVFKVGDLRQIPDGRALMLYQRLPAAVVQLPTWFTGSQAAMLRADMAAVRAARRS
jgi:type IV secretory pathway TraG/TraD family ATPase VirD4